MNTLVCEDLRQSTEEHEPTFDCIGFEKVIAKPIKIKMTWDKLSKFVQWKMFTAYMHEHNITDGNLFKRMRSMISEKRTNPFVQFDVEQQKIISVDFKHEVFIRERSKKGKLRVQLAHAQAEAAMIALEASINGLPIGNENIEVVEEEVIPIETLEH